MADLSPAAQAVLDALYMDELNGPEQLMARAHAAAALRAAAERNEYKPDMRDELEVMFSEGWNSHRKELLAIAAELEGNND
jgi:2-hydroxychromene-2-carboxylate isomerase